MEYDYYPEDEEEVYDKKRFSFGKLLKIIGSALIILVYALVFFRIWISNDTSLAKSFVWTEANLEAYEEGGGLSVYSQKLGAYTLRDEEGSVTDTVRYEELSPDGLFKVSNFMYVKETGEVIITLRYNDTCEKLYCEEYSLDPDDGEIFVFSITGGGKTYSDYTFITDERFTYHYRRLVFSDVDITNVSTLTLNGYCIGKPELESPVCEMVIYDSHLKTEVVDMRKHKPAELTPDIQTPPYIKFD